MKIDIIRHSLAHILAAAVQELYGGVHPVKSRKAGISPKAKLFNRVKFGIGPAIEKGFYYDFEFKRSLAPQDLAGIEKKMRELIKKNLKFTKKKISKVEAKKIFKNQPYKLELIKEISVEVGPRRISTYKVGDFVDLCKGPHVKSTLQLYSGQAKEIINAFKLTKIAGAYWKGDERNKMLTRIYGLAFENKKELSSYLKLEQEAEKRDHRVLGQKLELFLLDEEVGAGLPIWLPKGIIIRKIIEDYLYEELSSQGYQWLYTPHIGKLDLWKKSGHWDFYKENLYSPIKIDEEQYLLKPMNCPFHVKVYNSKIRSYRNLPLKFAELGTVYRYERSGVLHGLTRVRGFTQDDAHLICTPEQIAQELEKLVKQALKVLKKFGFKEYNIYLSTRPEKYAGTTKDWDKAVRTLEYVLKKLKLKYEIDQEGGVFYGPKIDIKIKDSLGREWQCTTIQFDFNLPERFKMTYVDKKGRKAEPFMIHRALLGSLERFFGVLIEHYAGEFPLWLAPVQSWIIPVGAKHKKYAKEIAKELSSPCPARPKKKGAKLPAGSLAPFGSFKGLRIEVKDENETVSKKIREGEIQKIPYVLVVGDKEMKKKSIRVRERGKGDIGIIKLKLWLNSLKLPKN